MELLEFNFNGDSITTYKDDNNNVWFCASDACKILEIQNVSQALTNNCDKKGIINNDVSTRGGKQKLLFINEPNALLKSLSMKSP